MAIRLKYDPVGPLFLTSYATGLAQGRERRRMEWEQRAQRTAEMFQQSRERAMDRAAMLQRDFMRDNVFLPAPGAVQGIPAKGPAAKAGLEAAAKAGMGQPALLGPGGVIGQWRPRDEVEMEQRQQEADLAFQRRQLGPSEVPEGVLADPDASTQWKEVDRQQQVLMGGREFPLDRPETSEAWSKLQDIKRGIEEKHPKQSSAELLNEQSTWRDPNTGMFYDEPGPGREQYVGGEKIDEKKEEAERKSQEKAAEKEQAARDKQKSVDEARLARDEAAILKNDEDYDTPVKKAAAIKELRDAHDEKYSQPVAPAAGVAAPTVSPDIEEQRRRMGFTLPPQQPAGGGADVSQGTIPKEWTPTTPVAKSLRAQATTGAGSKHVPITNAPDMQAAQLAEKFLPHPPTPAAARELGTGAVFVDTEGKIRTVP